MGLSAIVRGQWGEGLFAGHLWVFLGRRRDQDLHCGHVDCISLQRRSQRRDAQASERGGIQLTAARLAVRRVRAVTYSACRYNLASRFVYAVRDCLNLCVEISGCSEPEILTYYSVEVEADAKVTFSDGETKSVTIGGVDYDASVSASVRQLSPLCVTDAVPIGGVRLQLVVKDLERRVAQLEVGESPVGDDAGPPP